MKNVTSMNYKGLHNNLFLNYLKLGNCVFFLNSKKIVLLILSNSSAKYALLL